MITAFPSLLRHEPALIMLTPDPFPPAGRETESFFKTSHGKLLKKIRDVPEESAKSWREVVNGCVGCEHWQSWFNSEGRMERQVIAPIRTP
jgi:hypothetical protein